MIRKDILRAIRAKGEFVRRCDVADILGYKDPHSVDRYLRGLPRYGTKYLAEDVADAIVKGRQ